MVVSVRASNGVGRQAIASAALTLAFPGAGPPPAPVVVTAPEGVSPDRSALVVGWNEVVDEASGIVGYEYGVGTTADSPDILPWARVARLAQPYLVAHGSGVVAGPGGGMQMADSGLVSQGAAAGPGLTQAGVAGLTQAGAAEPQQPLTDYRVPLTGLGLTQGERYFVLVRATNGAGLSSLGASPPLLIDQTEPEVTLEAQSGQLGMLSLRVRLAAHDPESGLAAWRWDVWLTPQSTGASWRGSPWFELRGGATTDPVVWDLDVEPAGLDLNRPYHVRLQVRNRAGAVATTNEVAVQASGVTQGQWMQVLQSDGDKARLLRQLLESMGTGADELQGPSLKLAP